MGYEFRKLYADLVTDDGTLCILYLTGVRILGGWHARSGVEIYRPDGTRVILRGCSTEPPEPLSSSEKLAVPLTDGPFELHFETEHGAFAPGTPLPTGLDWQVRVARGRVSTRGAGLGVARGVGYSDWVTMTRTPRGMGLRLLQWGRAHTAKGALVFTAIGFADGTSWSVGAEWRASEKQARVSSAKPELDERGNGSVRVGASRLRLASERVLHTGPALDAERVPSWIDRVVGRTVGGKVRETRWLGGASLEGDAVEDRGRAVYERVRFG